ncbi:hypothetical protein BS47DRAFT_173612 [Hydnum rufescens UP504]|uniref:SH3 domain-containing protein n=1 Tax=Hydnum rufescens UP504 TaxID=1448309 RepID=A0A9P6AQQ9_9AGAM|nr:hypothetical protein BS47DRAFT_173612 [Hydnum rufescens UP504]
MPVSVTRASSPANPAETIRAPLPITQNAYPVIRTYIPSLLDELRVSVGDVVRVIREYDDGWAYCERVGDPDGAAGVVPLECLDKSGVGPSPSTLVPPSPNDQESERTSSRMSSFHIDFDNMHTGPVGA